MAQSGDPGPVVRRAAIVGHRRRSTSAEWSKVRDLAVERRVHEAALAALQVDRFDELLVASAVNRIESNRIEL